jgi:hypothetical protein
MRQWQFTSQITLARNIPYARVIFAQFWSDKVKGCFLVYHSFLSFLAACLSPCHERLFVTGDTRLFWPQPAKKAKDGQVVK